MGTRDFLMSGKGMLDDAYLEQFIREHGLDAEVLRLGVKVRTVEQAARALSVPKDQIIKSILLIVDESTPVLAIVGGDKRVDFRAVAKLVGASKVRMAKPEEVLRVCGYVVGGLPPVGHKKPIATIIDEGVMEKPYVFGGGGTDECLLRIRPEDIKRLQHARVSKITKQ